MSSVLFKIMLIISIPQETVDVLERMASTNNTTTEKLLTNIIHKHLETCEPIKDAHLPQGSK